MNHDDEPVRAEAASAYLDGELEAAERASVAADPETMTLVETFAQLRQSLGEVEPVHDDVRAAAMSAALAEFDARVQVPAIAAAPAARVTMLRTRWQRSYRVLSGVAAAAVIGVVAVAALNAGNGSDSKTSSASVPNDAAGSQRIEVPAESATALGAPGATSAAAGTAAPTDAAAADKTMAAAEVPAVNSADDLALYASSFAAGNAPTSERPLASSTPTATELVPMPAIPPSACLTSTDTVLGLISVFGAPAYALRDASTGVVRAIDAGDCHLLLSTAP